MGRVRDALGVLLQRTPREDRFRGRQQVRPAAGVNVPLLLTGGLVLMLVIAGWLWRGFGSAGPTAPVLPKPRPAVPQGAPLRHGFPHDYTSETHPALATVAEVPAKAPVPDDSQRLAMQALVDSMAWMAEQMKALEAKVGHVRSAPVSTAMHAPVRTDERQKALTEARKSGPIWWERSVEKNALKKPTPYTLAAGWNIPIEVEDTISNQTPGSARFWVTEAVSDSATGQNIVLPQYSYGLLEVSARQIFGDTDLPVRLTHLTLPNGTPIQVKSASVGDATGQAGFRDQIDRRWGSMLASILVQSVLRGGSGMMMGYGGDTASRMGAVAMQEASSQGQQAARQVINTSPIITIRAGYRGNVRLTEAIDLSSVYAR